VLKRWGDVIVEILGTECATHDNRAQNNFGNVTAVGPSPAPVSMFIKNPRTMPAIGKVGIEPAPIGWRIKANVASLESIPLQPNEERLITVEFRYRGTCGPAGSNGPGNVTDRRLCAKRTFDLSFALDGAVLGGVSSEIIVQKSASPETRWGGSFHLGTTLPFGDFGNTFDVGVMAGVDIEYRIAPRISLVGLLGHNSFQAASPSVSDTYFWNISVNGRYELADGPLRPYVNFGPGIYIPKSGSSDPGVNLGVGVLRDLGLQTVLAVGADSHRVFTKGEDATFMVFHVGLIHTF
jgi:hypothetical protein